MEFLKNKYIQCGLCLVGGIALGAVFYPQTKIEEKYKLQYEKKLTETEERHTTEVNELNAKMFEQFISQSKYRSETSSKIEGLIVENANLKQSMKRKKFKIVKPDGTVIEKEFEESNSESSSSTISQVKKEYDKQIAALDEKYHQMYEEEIEVVRNTSEKYIKKEVEERLAAEKEKIKETNHKALRPEVGITSEKNLYFHSTYEVFGPVFLGGGFSGDKNHFEEAHIGIGISL